MRKRLIVHIGMHKTGSSSIQHFLSRNRWALSAAGVLYPPSVGPDGRRQPKHNALFAAISHEADHGKPHPALGPSADLVAATAKAIADSRARVAVLSAEGFSGEKPAFAAALAPLGEVFDVAVVAFLRRPDRWLESFYRQMVLSREVREARPLAEFAAAPSTVSHLDYMAILDWWAEAFGAGALRLAPFEEAAAGAPAETPVRRFLKAAELPEWLALLPHSRAWRNRAAGDEAVRAALLANAAEISAPAPESRLSLTREERISVAEELERRWKSRDSGADYAMNPPPFIFSMLDAMTASQE